MSPTFPLNGAIYDAISADALHCAPAQTTRSAAMFRQEYLTLKMFSEVFPASCVIRMQMIV